MFFRWNFRFAADLRFTLLIDGWRREVLPNMEFNRRLLLFLRKENWEISATEILWTRKRSLSTAVIFFSICWTKQVLSSSDFNSTCIYSNYILSSKYSIYLQQFNRRQILERKRVLHICIDYSTYLFIVIIIAPLN